MRTRKKSELTPQALFDYARQFADKAEKTGRGTEFPTFAQAAKRFRVRIAAIEDAAEDWQGDGEMYVIVGIRCGSGVGEFKKKGEYLIEAYRAETVNA
jgi:hypothetical protein